MLYGFFGIGHEYIIQGFFFSALLALYSQRFGLTEFWWHNTHRRSVWYIFEFNMETYQCCQWMQFVLCARSWHHSDQNRIGIRPTMITWGRCWLVLTCSCMFNSLTPMRCGSNFSAILNTCYGLSSCTLLGMFLRWVSQNTFDCKSSLTGVMVWLLGV